MSVKGEIDSLGNLFSDDEDKPVVDDLPTVETTMSKPDVSGGRQAPAFSVNARELADAMGSLAVATDVRPPVFTGKAGENVAQWVRRFRTVAQALEWDDAKQLTQVPVYLTSHAGQWYNNVSEDGMKPYTTWKAFKDALLARFLTEDWKLQLKLKISQRKLQKNESVENYYNDMVDLCYEYDTKMDDLDVLLKLRNGLYPEIDKMLVTSAAKTPQGFFADLQKAAQSLRREEQANQRQQAADQRANNHFRRSGGKPEFHSKLTAADSNHSDASKPARTGNALTTPRKDKSCWNCGSTDHLLRDCPKRAKDAKGAAPRAGLRMMRGSALDRTGTDDQTLEAAATLAAMSGADAGCAAYGATACGYVYRMIDGYPVALLAGTCPGCIESTPFRSRPLDTTAAHELRVYQAEMEDKGQSSDDSSDTISIYADSVCEPRNRRGSADSTATVNGDARHASTQTDAGIQTVSTVSVGVQANNLLLVKAEDADELIDVDVQFHCGKTLRPLRDGDLLPYKYEIGKDSFGLWEKIPRKRPLYTMMRTSGDGCEGRHAVLGTHMCVDVTLNGQAARALVDTGANLSVVNRGFLERKLDVMSDPLMMPVELGDGSTIRTTGKIVLDVAVANQKLPVAFCVFDNVSNEGYECVLECNFLRQPGWLVDVCNATLLYVGQDGTTVTHGGCGDTVVTDTCGHAREAVMMPAAALCARMTADQESMLTTPRVNQLMKYGDPDVPEDELAMWEYDWPRRPVSDFDIGNADTTDGVSRITKLIEKYGDLFHTEGCKMGQAKVEPFRIDLMPGTKPKFRNQYRYAPPEVAEINRQISAMIDKGVIRPSRSDCSSPIVLARKDHGRSWRLCNDVRGVNSITIFDKHPLPRVDDCLQALSGKRYISTLDLVSGYWQMPLAEESKPLTAFQSPMGFYEYEELCFGLKNAPSYFQRTMTTIVGDLIVRGVVAVYLDDVIIATSTLEEHEEVLEALFSRCREIELMFKPKKCHFLKATVNVLGFTVTREGVVADPEKCRGPIAGCGKRISNRLAERRHRRSTVVAEPVTYVSAPEDPGYEAINPPDKEEGRIFIPLHRTNYGT
ncbi:uncharacterized protein LOC129589596 isoform X3 [Paramacrobiotus metropolitanus]|uniref:uncharacterized protein LOC129589596 isoform X3 n=1 Tax=Paramacrobiotus metropolitanus TaxID=2943436 RepID=UPI00244648B2|nr:uncharacterized protein LOC129589596 isoform X3 [Paramacrobiotus metropolitanus]